MKTSVLLITLIACIASCSSPAPVEEKTGRTARELVALIKQQQHPDSLKNMATLRSYTIALEEFVDNYPAEKEYQALLFQAATHAKDRHDMQQAAHYYSLYAVQFPEGEAGAQATFAAGFLYNNELQQLDSAEKYYNLLIANHPNHPTLSEAAKTELEYLGKTPEEMLEGIQKKTAQ